MFTMNYKLAALIGFLTVLPFMALEWATESDLPRSSFPIPLFIIMWVMSAVFVLVFMQILRDARAGTLMANSAVLFLKIAFLALIAWAWIGIVIDQMPCFLGGSGC